MSNTYDLTPLAAVMTPGARALLAAVLAYKGPHSDRVNAAPAAPAAAPPAAAVAYDPTNPETWPNPFDEQFKQVRTQVNESLRGMPVVEVSPTMRGFPTEALEHGLLRYDDRNVRFTTRLVRALEELTRIQLEMGQVCIDPDNAKWWTWGECVILNQCSDTPFEWMFGGEDTRPDDFPEGASVRVRVEYFCFWCGCTDRQGCDGGCYWAGPHLCSVCREKHPTEPPIGPAAPPSKPSETEVLLARADSQALFRESEVLRDAGVIGGVR